MSTAQQTPSSTSSRPWVTGSQYFALSIPATVLAAVVVTLNSQLPGYMDALISTPMGLRLTLAASAWLLLGVGAYLLGCVLVNRYLRGSDRTLLSSLLGIGCFILFCVPVIFMLQAGPAAVQIEENLSSP